MGKGIGNTMLGFKELYEQKKKTIDEAIGLIQSEDYIVTGLGASEPMEIMGNIHKQAPHVKGVSISNTLAVGNYEVFKPEYKESFLITSWFFSAPIRKGMGQGNITHVPQRLSSAFTKRNVARKIDGKRLVLLTTCSPMDEHGYLSLSIGCTYEKEAIEEGAIVIVEVNQQAPRTFGDTTIHISQIDALVEVDYPLLAIPIAQPNEKDLKIGKFIADLIEDGSTIQLGIGGIPNAVAEQLKTKKDLGIHTEMFTEGMMELMEIGAVNNTQKTIHPYRSVATFAMGSEKLYKYLDNNPSIKFMKGNYTNDTHVVGLNHKMVSINTTIEVDLFGQCASEAIGPIQFSGTGGQGDTAIGAQRSPGGKSFIALHSTAMVKNAEGVREEKSKIVPFLKEGSIVSLSRNDVDYVVTEYGVAHLKGRSNIERVERLIAVAHPDFREELWEFVRTNPKVF